MSYRSGETGKYFHGFEDLKMVVTLINIPYGSSLGLPRVGVCPVSPTCKAKDEGEPTVQVQGHGLSTCLVHNILDC